MRLRVILNKRLTNMDWKVWLKGLAAAAVGGAASGATQAISTKGAVNVGTAVTAAAGALVTVLAYLVKSPLGGTTQPVPADRASPAPPPAS